MAVIERISAPNNSGCVIEVLEQVENDTCAAAADWPRTRCKAAVKNEIENTMMNSYERRLFLISTIEEKK